MPEGFLRAQESFPGLDRTSVASPDAGAIVRSASIPVSYYTGIPSVSIPLWELTGRTMKIAISLQYHASGIKVEEMAGWTGLGWSLNAGGVISRTVRGIADDHQLGYLSTGANYLPDIEDNPDEFGSWNPPGETSQEQYQYLEYIVNNDRDAEPDIFSFSFNGRTGKFFFDPNGKIVMQSMEKLKIEYERSADNKIISWKITDEEGRIYTFGTEACIERTTNIYPFPRGEEYVSSWFLLSVESANREDSFYFSYSDYSKNVRYSMPQTKISNLPYSGDDLHNYSEQHIEGKYLSKVISPRETVEFEKEDVYSYVNGAVSCLRRINIYDNYTRSLQKLFRLDYSWFPSVNCGTANDYLPPCRRLRLDKIYDIAPGTSDPRPPTMLFYNNTPLPPRGSFARDHWGFYNGADNEHMISSVLMKNTHSATAINPYIDSYGAACFEDLSRINLNIQYIEEASWEYEGADREPHEGFMKAGLLERIVYPTGSSTNFVFEPHDFGYFSMPEPVVRHSVAAFDGFEKQIIRVHDPQQIQIIPLFYIEQGSNKDNLGMDPDPGSFVYIAYKGPLDRDSLLFFKESKTGDIDTVFSYDYETNIEDGVEWESFHKLWLAKAGEYELGAYAAHPDDYIVMLTDLREGSPDDNVQKIFSKEYEQLGFKAGEEYFPDDISGYCSEDFVLTEMDNPLVKLNFFFRSKLHPNRISTVGLEEPLTYVKLSETGGRTPEVIYHMSYYGDDLIRWNEDRLEYEYSGKIRLELPPGSYRLEFIPRIESEYGYINALVRKVSRILPYARAGGLRIAQIVEMDNASDTLGVTDFNYRLKDDDLQRSSGILMNWPVYFELPRDIFYMGSDFDPISNPPIRMFSMGKADPARSSGTHITYSQLTVSRRGTGKTVYRFTSGLDFPDISSNLFPYPPAISYDWKRGQLKEKLYYSENNVLQKKEEYSYNPLKGSANRSYIPALRVVKRIPGANYTYAFDRYYIPAGWNYMQKSEEIGYAINGENPLHIVKEYVYDSVHLQLKKTISRDSDSSRIETINTYPSELAAAGDPAINALMQKHMPGVPLITESFRGNERIKGSKINYDFYKGSLLLPSSIEILEGNEYRKRIFYDSYDSHGNILQYHRKGGVFNSINWDPLQLYPVAKTENSEYHPDIADYPPGSFITRYRYHPFWGVITETGPDNVSMHYVYNSYGDLEIIANDDGNILKEYHYHYKQYSGDTARAGEPIDFSLSKAVSSEDQIMKKGEQYPVLVLLSVDADVQEGDIITITAELDYALPPFNYSWEMKTLTSSDWILLKEIPDSPYRTSVLKQQAGKDDFYIRCRVKNGKFSLSELIFIHVNKK